MAHMTKEERQYSLPWVAHDGGARHIIDADGVVVVTEPMHPDFVVLAVNNHFRLLAALTTVLDHLRRQRGISPAIDEALAAIAAAEAGR